MKLTIIRIKPNPAGKDRPPHGGPSPAQLAAEWVDFRNDQGQDVSLNGVSLWHLTYAPGRAPEWAKVQTFSGTLPSGKIVRVHSGQKRELSVIRPEDFAAADYHVFTGEDEFARVHDQGGAERDHQHASGSEHQRVRREVHPDDERRHRRRADPRSQRLADANEGEYLRDHSDYCGPSMMLLGTRLSEPGCWMNSIFQTRPSTTIGRRCSQMVSFILLREVFSA